MSKETIPSNSSQLGAEVIDFEEARLNAEFAKLNPLVRIRKAYELFGDDLVVATSFGPTSPFLLQVASSIAPNIRVVNIQHGYETEMTKELAKWYTEALNLNVITYKAPFLPIPPEDDIEAFSKFQRKVKTEPFQQMINELEPLAYLSGIMDWQNTERLGAKHVERKGSILAINPLLGLSEYDIDYYLEVCNFPKNTDYFDPTKGASQKKECQLNTSTYR